MRPLVKADPQLVKEILPKIIDEGWTARKVERYMAERKQKSSTAVLKTQNYHKQEDALGLKWGAKVKIRGRSVTFACKNEEEMKKLIGRFGA